MAESLSSRKGIRHLLDGVLRSAAGAALWTGAMVLVLYFLGADVRRLLEGTHRIILAWLILTGVFTIGLFVTSRLTKTRGPKQE